jgi:hypothetical protein
MGIGKDAIFFKTKSLYYNIQVNKGVSKIICTLGHLFPGRKGLGNQMFSEHSTNQIN